jgi:hypothetical protein
VTATWDELGDQLVERYGGIADRVFSYQPAVEWIGRPEIAERWQTVAAAVRAAT